MRKDTVLFIMGPTATGKTDLALRLCEQLDSEIVSVDSAMVYRGMDIGTAKPSVSLRQQIPHHLIDICDPLEAYSAARFQQDAALAIRDIFARGKTPILVGGTGLYFRAIEQGLADLPAANYRIRASIEQQASELGWPTMHKRLQEVDPESAARINQHDPQRIQRALEVYEITGLSMTELLSAGRKTAFQFAKHKILLLPEDRQQLHTSIKQRYMSMIANGLVDEVKSLFERGDLSLDLPSMRLVGYRQVWRHLSGDTDYDTMIEHAIVATRQLAKRQITWFRRETDAICYDPLEKDIFSRIQAELE